MAVRLRLQRHGAKKRPFYRVVAADRRAPRDGRFIELLGTYDPLQEPPVIRLKSDRVNYWVGVGAIPSDTVQMLIKKMNEGHTIDLSSGNADKAALAARLENKKQTISSRRAQAIESAKKAAAQVAEAAKEKADAAVAEAAAANEAAKAETAPEAEAAPEVEAAPADEATEAAPEKPSEPADEKAPEAPAPEAADAKEEKSDDTAE